MNKYYLEGYNMGIDFDITNVNSFRPEIQSVFIKKENDKIEIWNPNIN